MLFGDPKPKWRMRTIMRLIDAPAANKLMPTTDVRLKMKN